MEVRTLTAKTGGSSASINKGAETMKHDRHCTLTEVMLATPDEDVGFCLLQEAIERARELAQEFGCPITVRDLITDRVYKTVRGRRH